MIGVIGQNLNTTAYRAKNNNQKPAFGLKTPKAKGILAFLQKKSNSKGVSTSPQVPAKPKKTSSGWDHMNAVREVWDNAKPGEKVKDLKKKLGIKKFVYIFGK